MTHFHYACIDASNLLISGQQISAFKKRMPGAETLFDASKNKVSDLSWRVCIQKIHQYLTGSSSPVSRKKRHPGPITTKITLVVSQSQTARDDEIATLIHDEDPRGTLGAFIHEANQLGWCVHEYTRNSYNKEKQVDVALAYFLAKDIWREHASHPRGSSDTFEVSLISGDSDFTPIVLDLAANGIPVDVFSWGPPFTSPDYIRKLQATKGVRHLQLYTPELNFEHPLDYHEWLTL